MDKEGLKRLAPGKWDARITWHDAKGKKRDTNRKINVSTEGGLRKETERAVVERNRLRDKLAGTGDEWTVEEALDHWLPTLPHGTRRTRNRHADLFREAFGDFKLSHVPTSDVQRLLADLKCKDNSANYHRSSFLALYKYARGKGRLKGENPIKETMRRHTAQTSAERLAEIRAGEARRALLGDEVPLFFAALHERHPDLHPLMYGQFLLGCRWAEAAALWLPHVDWKTGGVSIEQSLLRDGTLGPPKNGEARIAALGPEGLAFLRGHRAAMEAKGWPGSDLWLFPRPPLGGRRHYDAWSYTTAQRWVGKLLSDLGLGLANCTHAMRHTHVTLDRAEESDARARQATRDMQDAIGHADEKVTEGYTDRSVRQARATRHAAEFERVAKVVRLKPGSGGVPGGVPGKETHKKRGI
jgi:integrase